MARLYDTEEDASVKAERELLGQRVNRLEKQLDVLGELLQKYSAIQDEHRSELERLGREVA